MKIRILRYLMSSSKAILAVAMLVSSSPVAAQIAKSDSTAQVIPAAGEVAGIHDPSVIEEKSTWYVFSTRTGNVEGELPIHCSKDQQHWVKCGAVLKEIPAWIKKQSPGTKELWAPDISYSNGQFHLYYAFSLFGKNTSGIALLTNKTLDATSPEYEWKDEGLILLSKATDEFNAIDPNFVMDEKGDSWLSFGSFWTGIKMRRLDSKTGKLDASDPMVYSLAARKKPENPPAEKAGLPADWQAIEAPFIIPHDGYYYLFVSYDFCCRGTKSTYKISVGRSRRVNGGYLDEHGTPMGMGGATVILESNSRWVGPGGQSVMHTKNGDVMVFHAYDASTGKPSLQVSRILWLNGWPTVALGDGARK